MVEQLSASKRKFIASLRRRSTRRELKAMVIEGGRAVCDTAGLFGCLMLAATAEWLEQHADVVGRLKGVDGGRVEVYRASRADMERVTSLQSAPEVVAVCRAETSALDVDSLRGELVVALDGVQDPGNLGTIIRACDWFGVRSIICSLTTVDVYNAKVIQSTMGSLSRVKVYYADLTATLAELDGVAVYGTFLDGENLYEAELGRSGVIVMGNEGNGVSDEVARLVDRRLLIPSFAQSGAHVESLNVSMATAITLAEFRRRQI